MSDSKVSNLEHFSFSIEEQVLRFNISMDDGRIQELMAVLKARHEVSEVDFAFLSDNFESFGSLLNYQIF